MSLFREPGGILLFFKSLRAFLYHLQPVFHRQVRGARLAMLQFFGVASGDGSVKAVGWVGTARKQGNCLGWKVRLRGSYGLPRGDYLDLDFENFLKG